MLNKDFPDHHDAELVLRLYELRREPTMREARVAINTKFTPKTFEEFSAITKAMKLATDTPRMARPVVLPKPKSGPWVM